VAARLHALGIEYRVYDPWLPAALIDCASELAAVLACPVLTLHAELTAEQPWPSHHLLDAAALAQLAPDSLLINASRGAVVDNQALCDLLEQPGGPTAVLDVWEGEPHISAPLLERVQFGTPHIAGYSLDGKLLATRILLERMAGVLGLPWADPGSAAGEPPALRPGEFGADAQLLRRVLAQRYDIRTDDNALRAATLGADSTRAAVAFAQLRRNYPVRRELAGSRVEAVRLSARAAQLLTALGCVLPDAS
jgi:erythronate-4-phosphate dehydrogenase